MSRKLPVPAKYKMQIDDLRAVHYLVFWANDAPAALLNITLTLKDL